MVTDTLNSDRLLSIVVPVFNEVESLRPLVEQVKSSMDTSLGFPWELVLVDDASSDGSGELMDVLARGNPGVRAFHLVNKSGQSAALEAGIQRSRGSFIALMDADLQTHPGDLPMMVEDLEEQKVDAVIGVRTERHDTAWKKLTSKIANGVRNWLTSEDITDTGCPIKVFRREAISAIGFFDGAHRFLPTLLKMKGFELRQVPIRHTQRKWGMSKYGTWDRAFRGLYDALGVRWIQKRNLSWKIRRDDDPT